jgi:putative nucleotidyltransferase with HDIG domain
MESYIHQRIQQIEFLPTLPHIVGEVMRIIEDPKSSASDLVKHMDPSMVGEVMRVANSAYFGRNSFRRIGTIEQAVAVIGYAGLSHMILHMPFLSMIKGRDDAFNRKEFMRHSICCAILARTVSVAFSAGNPHQAYIAGMLHDIGLVIMYQYFREEWQKIRAAMEQKQWSRPRAEREVLSVDHAEVGACLLDLWDIPESVTRAVRLHHAPDAIDEGEDAYAVWLANILTKRTDFQSDFKDFDTFYKKQRDVLQLEMPQRYLLKHHVDLLEHAYGDLKDIEKYLDAVGAGE